MMYLTTATAALWDLNAAILLGQGRVGNLRKQFRNGTDFELKHMVIVLAVLVVIGVVAWLIARYVKYRETNGVPGALFRELCRAHQLDWGSRQLLKGLASHHGITPASLFVQPTRFDDLEQGPLKACAEQVRALREKLFAK